MGNFYLIVLDGVGVGAQEDAHLYGDDGSNTLGHVSAQQKVSLPNLQHMGLGNILPLDSVPSTKHPRARVGKMREKSAGKDSTTGHWEIAGHILEAPFPTYYDGFPLEVLTAFESITGRKGVLANKPYSGTEVIQRYGKEHLETGSPIVYTSADSVFQVATHTDSVSIEQLYDWCSRARTELMIGEHNVGRVIARPFHGPIDAFSRITEKRKDYSAVPPKVILPSYLHQNGIKTYSIGKIIDLFAGIGFNQTRKTAGNAEGISHLLSCMQAVSHSFVFVNLIDFDQLFGHRNDPAGFADSLEEFDRALPAIVRSLKNDDILIITADHGNDPTSNSSDHSREFVPLLMYSPQFEDSSPLGIRDGFTDIAVTACDFFGLSCPFPGKSLLT